MGGHGQSQTSLCPHFWPRAKRADSLPKIRGNHLSNATCLAQFLFQSGESYSKLL